MQGNIVTNKLENPINLFEGNHKSYYYNYVQNINLLMLDVGYTHSCTETVRLRGGTLVEVVGI